METPPNVLGFIDNAWFEYVADFGNAGPDRGQGGTLIVLPPDYDEDETPQLRSQFPQAQTYKVNLPGPVPAKDFWSFTLYDNQTRSMLQTDQRFPGIDSNKEGLKTNPDGSVDIYVGPTPPSVRESNWIQSAPGKGWNVLLRLYGPLEPWFNKTWVPGDFERVE